MDSFTSSKPSSVTHPSFSDAGGNNENELNSEMAKNQLPTKSFMSHTICTANKATHHPRKKILTERNQTLDVVDQTRSPSFDSKSVKSAVVNSENDVQKPYDPVNNYLSPRPKFLRYNPNRRRKIYVLEESVRSSSSFDAGLPSPGMELGADSSGFVDSCSQKESVEQALEDEEGEVEEDEEGEREEDEEEEEEEEEIEFQNDRFWNLKGLLKFVVVVIAVIYTTQAICSMNSPTPFQTEETWSNVYGVAGLNFSEVGTCSLRGTELVVGRLKEVDMVESINGVQEDEVISKEETSDSFQELGIRDVDVEITADFYENEEIAEDVKEIYDVEGEREDDGQMLTADSGENEELTEHEVAEEMEEIYNVEVEKEEDDQMLTADSGENEELTEHEIAEEMKEIFDVQNIDEMFRSESFDLLAVLIGAFMLILTSFGVYSKRVKFTSPVTASIAGAKHEAEKEEIRVLEPSATASFVTQQMDDEEEEKPLMDSKSFMKHDVSEEFSNVHAPSVELLGEFVFGVEADASNSLIQSTGETKSSHMENSTGDSVAYTEKTVKKPRRKNVEAVTTVVTPSPMRRSSRLQNRSIKSP